MFKISPQHIKSLFGTDQSPFSKKNYEKYFNLSLLNLSKSLPTLAEVELNCDSTVLSLIPSDISNQRLEFYKLCSILELK